MLGLKLNHDRKKGRWYSAVVVRVFLALLIFLVTIINPSILKRTFCEGLNDNDPVFFHVIKRDHNLNNGCLRLFIILCCNHRNMPFKRLCSGAKINRSLWHNTFNTNCVVMWTGYWIFVGEIGLSECSPSNQSHPHLNHWITWEPVCQ